MAKRAGQRLVAGGGNTPTATQTEVVTQQQSASSITKKEYTDSVFNGSGLKYNEDNTVNYEQSVIAGYTGSDYIDLNAVLGGYYESKNGEKPSASLTKKVKRSEELLNRALDQIPSKSGTTYRGMSNAQLKSQLLNAVGGEVQFKGFSSTSSDKNTANNFARGGKEKRVMLVINGKNGKPIENLSAFKAEKEVLYKSNSKFKIDRYDKRTDTFHITEIGG